MKKSSVISSAFSSALILLTFLSFPKIVSAQDFKGCASGQTYINEVDNASICLSKGEKTGDLIFIMPRFKINELSSVVTITIMDSGIKMVSVSDDKVGIFKSTIFLLDGRSFLRWLNNPNTDLVEKHRRDVSSVLDAIEQYNRKPSDLQF